ncbi:MAG: hypothetical protein AB2993_07670 (plasmid) [Candidatus Symbiodolus clandestinus]
MLSALYHEQGVMATLLRHRSINDTLQDRLGRTAFFFAKYSDQRDLVKMLLQHPRLSYAL